MRPSSPQTSARQLPGLTQSSGPQPGNSTLSSPLLLEDVVIALYMILRLRRLQSEFSSLCTSCVACSIESGLGLRHHDGLISSHTTIKLVLSNSSENPNPNSTRLSDSGTEGAATFSSKTSPSLVCGVSALLIVAIHDVQNLSNTACS